MIRIWRFIRIIVRLIRWESVGVFLRRVAGLVVFLAVLGGLLAAVQGIPEWEVRRASVRSTVVNPEAKTTPADVAALQNEMRKTFIQVVGGAFALFALYFTYRRVKVAEQGHITDRYTKAIEQLGALTAAGKPNVEVRLGSIYALERIAFDSPRDHWTIMEVLTAYVRQNAPAPEQVPTKEENEKAIVVGPSTEIQAILTVLGRRRRGRRHGSNRRGLDLGDSDLRGADFQGARLDSASFYKTHLEGASFVDAHVVGAHFNEAHLEGAAFISAHVEGASFCMAHVEGVRFDMARVEETYFDVAHVEGAIFNGAHIEGASFEHAVGLTVSQFTYAEGWEQAGFDEPFLQELKSAKRKEDKLENAIPPPETHVNESHQGGNESGE